VSTRRGEASVESVRAGLAVFTAELMQRGAGPRGALELARTVDEIGASLDASADWDSVEVQISGLTRDAERLYSVLFDVVLRPRFERNEAEKARAQQLAGIGKKKDDPASLAAWQIARTLYAEHRFGLPLEGTLQTVPRLDAAAARAFHARIFVPANAIFFASGDFEFEELLERVQAGFAGWAGGPIPDAGAPPPRRVPEARRVVIVDRPDLEQAQIVLGHEGISRREPTRYAATLMNTVLGAGGFSSRLMASVRAEAGLTYSVYSGFAMRRAPGPFFVSTFTRVSETRRVIDLLLSEVARMRDVPPNAGELRDAQSQTVGGFALGLETSDALVAALVGLDVQGLPDDSLDRYRAKVRAVSVEDAARAARDRLHPERAAIVVVGPAAALRAQLEGLGPIELSAP
jgi:zinc protease